MNKYLLICAFLITNISYSQCPSAFDHARASVEEFRSCSLEELKELKDELKAKRVELGFTLGQASFRAKSVTAELQYALQDLDYKRASSMYFPPDVERYHLDKISYLRSEETISQNYFQIEMRNAQLVEKTIDILNLLGADKE